jgi:hypothetical protein
VGEGEEKGNILLREEEEGRGGREEAGERGRGMAFILSQRTVFIPIRIKLSLHPRKFR